jgi:hypothetical protein
VTAKPALQFDMTVKSRVWEAMLGARRYRIERIAAHWFAATVDDIEDETWHPIAEKNCRTRTEATAWFDRYVHAHLAPQEAA